MMTRHVFTTAACTAALALPLALSAQDTTRTRQDSSRMRRDSAAMRMQDTTRRNSTTTTRMPRATSQQRYRVQKGGEAAGTLETPPPPPNAEQMRADSIAAAEKARRDSVDMAMQRQRDSLANIERMRADSVARVEKQRTDSIAAIERARADSVARADSIAAARQAEMSRYRFGGNGWYVGLAAGASAPTSDFKNLGYNSGFALSVPIGWHKPNNALGVRFDFGYARFSGRTFTGNIPAGSAVTLENPNPQVLSGTVNVTLATPMSLMRNVRLYAVGGGGLYHFRSFGGGSALGGFLGNDVLQTNESNTKMTRNKFGAQVGGGLDWTVGTSAVYVESRFVNVFTDRDDNVAFNDFFGSNRSKTLKWVPIVLGVKIR